MTDTHSRGVSLVFSSRHIYEFLGLWEILRLLRVNRFIQSKTKRLISGVKKEAVEATLSQFHAAPFGAFVAFAHTFVTLIDDISGVVPLFVNTEDRDVFTPLPTKLQPTPQDRVLLASSSGNARSFVPAFKLIPRGQRTPGLIGAIVERLSIPSKFSPNRVAAIVHVLRSSLTPHAAWRLRDRIVLADAVAAFKQLPKTARDAKWCMTLALMENAGDILTFIIEGRDVDPKDILKSIQSTLKVPLATVVDTTFNVVLSHPRVTPLVFSTVLHQFVIEASPPTTDGTTRGFRRLCERVMSHPRSPVVGKSTKDILADSSLDPVFVDRVVFRGTTAIEALGTDVLSEILMSTAPNETTIAALLRNGFMKDVERDEAAQRVFFNASAEARRYLVGDPDPETRKKKKRRRTS